MARPSLPVQRPSALAWYIAAPLFALAVGLTAPVVLATPDPFGKLPVAVVYLAVFVLAETIVLHFEVRRQTMTVAVGEIPLLVALFFLPPGTVLLVRVLAKAVVHTRQHVPPVKMAFNLATAAAGTAVANVIVHAGRPLAAASPRTWLVLAAAVGAAVLTSLAAVVGVVTLVQGRTSRPELVRIATPGLVMAGVNCVIGLIALILLQQSPWAALLLAALGAVMVLVYRAYAKFFRQHKSLAEIYDLARSIGANVQDGRLPDVLLHRVRKLLEAESATLWLPAQGRHPEVLLSARVDYPGLLDVPGTPDLLRRRVLERGATVFVGPRVGPDDLRAQLRIHRVKDAIVVPLLSGSAVIGALEVAGKIGSTSRFTDDDVRLVETLAAQVAVAIENSRLVDRLRFDAYHDPLTGLPNRRRVVDALDEALTVRVPGEVVGVLLFDVSGLRDVNDSLGHRSGDEVLAEIARRLRELAPPAALVGRVGGDEFAVLVREDGPERAARRAEELRTALRQPMALGDLIIGVDATVGVAVHPDHGDAPEQLLQRADLACHAAKPVNSAVQLFNPGLESRSVHRLGLAGELRRALDAGELRVYYQPKVALGDRRLVGVECLARWEHPVHGSVSPEDFVAVAEHTGQLPRLTEWVLRDGLGRARDWAAAGRPLDVSVNLSSGTLLDPGFPGLVRELLAEHGVPPGRLTLEIAEHGVLGDPERPLTVLRRLRDDGVRLSVDDFGTGYSSLAYLRRLPVHEVKVDRTFVQGMATDPGDLAIVRAVVDLSRHFGLTAVAEGVESELTLGLLEEMGCDVGQGFLFSRPLPYERFEAWYGAQTAAEPPAGGEVRWLRAVP